MEPAFALIIAAVIPVVLLALYVYAIVTAVRLARDPQGGPLNDGFALVLQTVGGLVSALAILVLGLTKPGETPKLSSLVADSTPIEAPWEDILTSAYLAVWLGAGVTAFVVGMLHYPGKVPALTDHGRAWLGLALAAAYAYFGLEPPAS